jgi:ribonucleotide reductase beta subunit family protein with ferritin-like domain
MSKTVFNKEKVDFTKQNMFFGEDGNTQRYDVFKFPQFDKLNQTMLGYFWRPEEVSLQKDRADYANFRPEQKHIFTANLKYQTLLDSVQGRGPCLSFLPHVSLPELEGCIVTWDFFETIHSRSYTHIMKNVSAKIISLIARDEAQHLALSTHILKLWASGKDDPEMVSIAKECEEEVYELWRNCVQEEKEWANYLFKDGSIIGLNETLLHQYVEYIANRRLKALGMNAIFDAPVNTNPLPWTQHWLSSSGLQVAPQETEVESYVIGGIKQDVDKDSLKGFSL